MEAFIGTWKFIQGEGYDQYLRATGAEEEVIAISNVLKPVVTISQYDDIVSITVQSGLGTEEKNFRLGKEFHLNKKDGRFCKVIVYLKEDQLIQVKKWDSKEAVSVIKIKDGKMIKTITFKDITAVQTFEKV